jgi:hypothetical protein
MSQFPLTDAQVLGVIENPESLGEDGFQALFDYYLNNGEMPYGVAKARTGDPDLWIHQRLEERAARINSGVLV